MRLLLILTASACFAQNTLTPEEKKAGWKLLFDGKTTNGWRDPSKMKPAGDSWTVSEGCLKATGGPKFSEDLVSVAKFGDFELQWAWKISPAGNSGVKYRIQEFGPLMASELKKYKKFEDAVDAQFNGKLATRRTAMAAPGGQIYVVGFEYQMIDDDRHPDARRGAIYQSGSLYSMIARTRRAVKPIGEFNQSRLVVKGQHIEHWLNGEKVLDASLDDPSIEAGLRKRWGPSSPVYRMLVKQPRKPCPISLQNHHDEAWFRDIKIKKL